MYIYNIYVNSYFKTFSTNFYKYHLNVNNDPCFEDKSSSLTLKYRPVHFFESSCRYSSAELRRPLNCFVHSKSLI